MREFSDEVRAKSKRSQSWEDFGEEAPYYNRYDNYAARDDDDDSAAGVASQSLSQGREGSTNLRRSKRKRR